MNTPNKKNANNEEALKENRSNSNSNLLDEEESRYLAITPLKIEKSNLYLLRDNSEIKFKKNIRERTFATCPTSFESLVKKDVFIDKSLIIKEVLEDSSDHILITRPRRWGKTLNMKMLKTFLEIEVDKKDMKQLAPERRLNPKLFNNLEIKKGNYIDTDLLCKI
jgi:hypothetical protein